MRLVLFILQPKVGFTKSRDSFKIAQTCGLELCADELTVGGGVGWSYDRRRQRQSKSVFVDNFVKMISDAKSFIWNFFGNLVNKADGTVKDFNSVYCNNCL